MPPKGLGLAGAAGCASALVTLSVISGGGLGVLLAYVTPLPLVLIGLAYGLRLCLIGISVAALVIVLAALSALPAFAVIGGAPAVLVTFLALPAKGVPDARMRRSPGEILVFLTLGAVAMMLVTALAIPAEGKGIEAWLRREATPVIEAGLPQASVALKAAFIGLWVAVMPALIGGAWLVMTVLNGLFGQWAVNRAGHGVRPAEDYTRLRLPMALAAAAAAAGLIGFVGGDIGFLARNIALLLVGPYMFAGLADLHGRLRRRPQAGLWLALFYGAFLALFGWAAVAVTGWGLVRQWMRSRRPEPAFDQEDQ